MVAAALVAGGFPSRAAKNGYAEDMVMMWRNFHAFSILLSFGGFSRDAYEKISNTVDV